MDASTMLERAKARLIEAAEKEYGKIEPYGDNPFTKEDGVLYFCFKTPDNYLLDRFQDWILTHFVHTHLIHEEISQDNIEDVNDPRCVECGRSPRIGAKCDYVYRGSNCHAWWNAHLTPGSADEIGKNSSPYV